MLSVYLYDHVLYYSDCIAFHRIVYAYNEVLHFASVCVAACFFSLFEIGLSTTTSIPGYSQDVIHRCGWSCGLNREREVCVSRAGFDYCPRYKADRRNRDDLGILGTYIPSAASSLG